MEICLNIWLKMCLYELYKTRAGVNIGSTGKPYEKIIVKKVTKWILVGFIAKLVLNGLASK